MLYILIRILQWKIILYTHIYIHKHLHYKHLYTNIYTYIGEESSEFTTTGYGSQDSLLQIMRYVYNIQLYLCMCICMYMWHSCMHISLNFIVCTYNIYCTLMPLILLYYIHTYTIHMLYIHINLFLYHIHTYNIYMPGILLYYIGSAPCLFWRSTASSGPPTASTPWGPWWSWRSFPYAG